MVLESEFPPDTRVENEISALLDAGHTVEIACFTKSNRPLKESKNGYVIYRKKISEFIHKTSVGSLKFPFYFNFWRKFLKRLIKTYGYDAIHIHDLPLAKVGYEIKKKFDISLTIDLHENWPGLLKISTHTQTFLGKILSSNKRWEAYEKNILKKANNIIVVVEESKNRIIDLGIKADKIHIVSNTLNTFEFQESEQKGNPDYTTLYYAGAINKHRGIQTAIEAIPYIAKEIPNIRLWLVGKGSYVNTLKNQVEQLGIKDKVNFMGWKPLKEVAEYLSQSDIALIPHLRSDHTDSTIPHKLFQYMYIQKPILASDCIPLKRIIEETKSGLCFENNNAKDFADKAIRLIKESKILTDMNLAKSSVIEKYNWNVDKQRLVKIYS